MSGIGTKQTYRDVRYFVRFRGKADVDPHATSTFSVAIDSKRT
jgi:hypothetical protein